jgi:hypothetical protein
MDTKKVVAEAALGIRKNALQVVGHLDCLRANPSYTGNIATNSEVLLRLGNVDANVESKVGQFTMSGSYATNEVVNNARKIMKGFMPDGHSELRINESGYPIQLWIDAPHVKELLAIRSSYALLIAKRTWEAGWGHGQVRIFSGQVAPPPLELITCSTCGKATYNRGHSEPEGSLCFACLSLHLDRALYLNHGLSAPS